VKKFDELLLDSEEVLMEVHPFKGPLIVPTIATLICLIGGLALINYLPRSAPVWVGLLLVIPFVISAIWLITVAIKLRSVKYLITNERVISISGIISHNLKDISLNKIQAISYHQSLLGRIFNVGSVVIQSAGMDPYGEELLNSIHNPKGVYRQLRSLIK